VTHTPVIGAGAGKFLGVPKIFFHNFPKLGQLYMRIFSPIKDHEDEFLAKKIFMCHSANVGRHFFFLNQTMLGATFARNTTESHTYCLVEMCVNTMMSLCTNKGEETLPHRSPSFAIVTAPTLYRGNNSDATTSHSIKKRHQRKATACCAERHQKFRFEQVFFSTVKARFIWPLWDSV